MANPYRSFPAQFSPQSTALIAVLITTAVTLSLLATTSAATTTTTAIDQELETAITTLRRRGYTLFANAISTSELRYPLLSSSTAATNFTLFCPRDASLFALDMSSSASDYVRTLRYHVTPYRLSFSDLQSLSRGGGAPASMETLLPRHRLLMANSNVSSNDTVLDNAVTVDGVLILVPDLFVGAGFAVHGLDGILEARFSLMEDKFSGDLGFLSPSASTQECLSNPPSSKQNDGLGVYGDQRLDDDGEGIGHNNFAKVNHQILH